MEKWVLFHSDKAEFDDIVIGLTELYEQWKTIEYLKRKVTQINIWRWLWDCIKAA